MSIAGSATAAVAPMAIAGSATAAAPTRPTNTPRQLTSQELSLRARTVAWSFSPAHLAASENDIGVKGRANVVVGVSRRGCSLLAVAGVDRCSAPRSTAKCPRARQARFSLPLTRSSASLPSRDARRRTGRPILRRETRV
jgi:hypothetical protein